MRYLCICILIFWVGCTDSTPEAKVQANPEESIVASAKVIEGLRADAEVKGRAISHKREACEAWEKSWSRDIESRTKKLGGKDIKQAIVAVNARLGNNFGADLTILDKMETFSGKKRKELIGAMLNDAFHSMMEDFSTLPLQDNIYTHIEQVDGALHVKGKSLELSGPCGDPTNYNVWGPISYPGSNILFHKIEIILLKPAPGQFERYLIVVARKPVSSSWTDEDNSVLLEKNFEESVTDWRAPNSKPRVNTKRDILSNELAAMISSIIGMAYETSLYTEAYDISGNCKIKDLQKPVSVRIRFPKIETTA